MKITALALILILLLPLGLSSQRVPDGNVVEIKISVQISKSVSCGEYIEIPYSVFSPTKLQ